MYPFCSDYKVPIQGFIDRLNTLQGLRVVTTATATMVVGEFDAVMKAFSDMLEWSYRTYGRAVYVTKFIPDYNPD
ncbi:MAG: histidine kinase, partial [Pseudomonadota bacterium]